MAEFYALYRRPPRRYRCRFTAGSFAAPAPSPSSSSIAIGPSSFSTPGANSSRRGLVGELLSAAAAVAR
jgi:hypothetical protein